MKTLFSRITTPLSYQELVFVLAGMVCLVVLAIFLPTIYSFSLFFVGLSGIFIRGESIEFVGWCRKVLLMAIFSIIALAMVFMIVEKMSYLNLLKSLSWHTAKYMGCGMIVSCSVCFAKYTVHKIAKEDDIPPKLNSSL